MKHKKIKVTIRSGFAVGLTTRSKSRAGHGGETVLELVPDTTVKDMLHTLTSIGLPQ